MKLMINMIGIMIVSMVVCVIGQSEIPHPPGPPTDPVLGETSPDPNIFPTDELPPVAIPDELSNSPPVPSDSNGLDLTPSPGSDVMDDVEASNSVITTDACTEAMTSICKLGNTYSFEESLRCLESHVNELQGACSVALNVMMSNLYSDCGEAVSTLCSDSASSAGGDESVYVLSCLSNHKSELSADCQEQLDMYLNEEYPCTKEATLFCSDKTHQTPEQTLGCLETIATTSPDEISLQCATILHGFSSCKDGPDGEDPEGNGKPGPKPKPRARYLTGTSEASSTGDLSTTSRGDKPKPRPKPKPGPGGERRCWQGRVSEGEGAGGFLEGLSGLGGHSTSDASDTSGMSTGVVMSSLIVVLALVGVAGVKYRQSQEDVHTQGGYWRAPSIQAMLFDDSAHSYRDDSPLNGGSDGGASSGVVMSRVVEMEDLKSGDQRPTVEAIQVTLSPITHSDEMRV
mmetsp:Transcript_22442/g.38022  ORF Transcript_22442/g.38022 Transcript_22442/m.38022 type:complete len:458 (+) Transcript_22442:122-1495(+)